jgi:hypothetical protein
MTITPWRLRNFGIELNKPISWRLKIPRQKDSNIRINTRLWHLLLALENTLFQVLKKNERGIKLGLSTVYNF